MQLTPHVYHTPGLRAAFLRTACFKTFVPFPQFTTLFPALIRAARFAKSALHSAARTVRSIVVHRTSARSCSHTRTACTASLMFCRSTHSATARLHGLARGSNATCTVKIILLFAIRILVTSSYHSTSSRPRLVYVASP